MIRLWKVLGVVALLTLFASGTAMAVPNLLTYQGRLTDNAGAPLDGGFTVRFAIYADSLGTTQLWTETLVVTVANGLFSVQLGRSVTIPPTVYDGSVRWVGLRVSPDVNDMVPRQRLSSLAYALRAGTSDDAGGVANRSFGAKQGIPNAAVVIDSVDITTTAAGYIEVEAGGNAYVFHANGVGSTGIYKVDEQRFNVSYTAGYIAWYQPSTLPSGLYGYSVVSHRVYQKPAGTHRFYFNLSSGATEYNIQAHWVTATYVGGLLGGFNKAQSEPEVIYGEFTRPPAERYLEK